MPIPKNGRRLEIQAWDGINRTAGPAVAKSQEPVFAENVSAGQVGVLDSRLSSVRTSTSSPASNVPTLGGLFQTINSSGLISGTSYTGIFRVSNFSGSNKSTDGEELEELRNTGGTGTWATSQPLLSQLGDATTSWSVTKPGGTTARYVWNTPTGTNPQIGLKLFVGKSVTISLPFVNSANNGTFTVTALRDDGVGKYFEVVNAAAVAEGPIAAGIGGYIDSTQSEWFSCDIEGGLILTATNRSPIQVRPNPLSAYKYDFFTVADSTGDISGMPWAKYAAFFKGKIYAANILVYTGYRYSNLVMMSSPKVGIVANVEGDHAAGSTSIKVTETKYIFIGDTLRVYRDGTEITSFTVTSKTPTSVGCAATAAAISSSDQLWVDGTYTGRQLYRWSSVTKGISPSNPNSFTAGDDGAGEVTLLDVAGNSLLIGTPNSVSSWNGTALTALETEAGPISRRRGWTKLGGNLYYASALGMFRTSGGKPEPVTNAIKDYWVAAQDLPNAVLWNNGYSIFAYVGSMSIKGDDGSTEKTITNAIVEFDTVQENVFIHSYPTVITHAEEITTNGTRTGSYLNITNTPGFFSNNLPSTVVWASSTTSDIGDVPYVRIDTNWLYPNAQFEKPSYLWFCHADVLQGDGIKLFLKTDDLDWNEVGELKKGVNTITLAANPTDPASSPRCRRFKLSFRSATGKLLRLGRVAVDYTSSLEQQPNPDEGSYDWMSNN